MYVTYPDLFSFCMLIIAFTSLIFQVVFHIKKK